MTTTVNLPVDAPAHYRTQLRRQYRQLRTVFRWPAAAARSAVADQFDRDALVRPGSDEIPYD